MKDKNPKGAGRKPKFTTETLLDIISIYKDKGLMKGKISYSEIARFGSEELGYSELKYYHVSNDKIVSDLINQFNNAKHIFFNANKDILEGSIYNVDVVELINSNYNNKQSLIMYLENYKRSYDLTIKELLQEKEINIRLSNDLEKLESNSIEISNKNKKLKQDIKLLIDDNKILRKKVAEIGENDLVMSLKSTKLFPLLDEEHDDLQKDFVDLKARGENNGSDIELFLNRFPELFNN